MSKKTVFFTMLGTTVLISVIAGPVIYQIVKKEKNNSDANENKSNYERKTEEVFPQWNSNSFDKFIEYKQNEIVFNKELVSYFISQTIKRLGVSKGRIDYSYNFDENLKHVDIFLKWSHGKEVKRKKYSFYIDGI